MPTGPPDEATLERERKKIRRWRELGFLTEGLEELLSTDFEAYKERRVALLKEQAGEPEPPEKRVKKFKPVSLEELARSPPGRVPSGRDEGGPGLKPPPEPPAEEKEDEGGARKEGTEEAPPAPPSREAAPEEAPGPEPEPERGEAEETAAGAAPAREEPGPPEAPSPPPTAGATPAEAGGAPMILVGDKLAPIKRAPKPKGKEKVIVVGEDKEGRRAGKPRAKGARPGWDGKVPRPERKASKSKKRVSAGKKVRPVKKKKAAPAYIGDEEEEEEEPEEEMEEEEEEYDEEEEEEDEEEEEEEEEEGEGDEYDEEEEEYDEDEEDEDDEDLEGRRRRGRRKKKKEGGRGFYYQMAAIIVVCAIILIIVYRPVGDDNGGGDVIELKAHFAVIYHEGREPFTAGELISFDAGNSTGRDLNYTWRTDLDNTAAWKTLGDDDGRVLTGYFTRDGEVEVTLEVEDAGGGTETFSRTIPVDPLVVNTAEEMIGDWANYLAYGSLGVSNPNGLVTVQEDVTGEDLPFGMDSTATLEFTINSIDLDFTTEEDVPMSLELRNGPGGGKTDGYFDKHDTYVRYMDQSLAVTGKAYGTTNFTGTDQMAASIDGQIDTSQYNYIDLETDAIIQTWLEYNNMDMDVSLDYDAYPWQEEFTSDTTANIFPDLRTGHSGLHLSEMGETFYQGEDAKLMRLGDVSYTWEVERAGRAGVGREGQPCLKIHVIVDQETLMRNDLQVFYTDMWVGDGHSLPVKYNVYARSVTDDDTVTEFDYWNEMSDHERGLQAIGTNCDAEGVDGNHFARDYTESDNDDAAAVAAEFTDSWTYIPSIGSTPNSLTRFTPQQAISQARSDAVVDDYLDSNPDAYVVEASIAPDEDGDLEWHMVMGTKGSSEGVEFRAVKGGGVSSKELDDMDAPVNSTDEFPVLLTFRGCEQILHDIADVTVEPMVDEWVFGKGGGVGDIELEEVSFGTLANFANPTVDLTSFSNLQRVRYAFDIESVDEGETRTKTFRCAVDAETGQLLIAGVSEETGAGGFSVLGF